MSKLIFNKVTIIALLTLLLLIPLSLIEDVINERSYFRAAARQDIAASWTGAQKLLGPLLVLPYQENVTEKVWDPKLEQHREVTKRYRRSLLLLPDELKINASITTETRRRGLYEVPVYQAQLAIQGSFSNRGLLELLRENKNRLEIEDGRLAVLVSDVRGLVEQPKLSWDHAEFELLSGSGLSDDGSGMHAGIGRLDQASPKRYPFHIAVSLRGMESIAFSPVGKDTRVEVDAAWPHPSFTGRFLPTQHQIEQDRFSAVWQASAFASDMARTVQQMQKGDLNGFLSNTFGVSLIDPVDIYQQTERSVKYGVLFLALSFTVFFLFEVMKQLQLHPMQYLLVGLALTVFYLLLLSLSEHISFGPAYLIATLASASLIGVYLSAVLQNRPLGSAFAGLLFLLYGMLYAILRSEDNALLMGSLLLFSVLALVMLVTRKLDWYAVSEQIGQQARGLRGERSEAPTA
jgi:inner membrane protein